MSILYNDGTKLHSTNLERPRTDVTTSGVIGALNGVLELTLNGESTVRIDARTAALSATFTVEATVDGTNYFVVPLYNQMNETYTTIFTAAGSWLVYNIAGFKSIRVRCSAYTSGAATVTITASLGIGILNAKTIPNTLTATNTAAAGSGVTLTITSGGAGLWHNISYLRIDRFAAALLTAAATPVVVTTTNIPGSLAFTFPADAAAQGTVYTQELVLPNPLKVTNAATNTTIVCPATTNVIWRVTAIYFNSL